MTASPPTSTPGQAAMSRRPRVLYRPEIEAALAGTDLVAAMAEGFLAYAQGRCVVPPVGELLFDDPPGDAHIKYGYVRGDDVFVVKVASGFYHNPARGLPANDGLVLVCDQRTGFIRAVLLDEGMLTNERTAAAGALVARHLAPSEVRRIGIIGAGIQARLQLLHLRAVTACREVAVYARRQEAAAAYRAEMEVAGFRVHVAASPGELAALCNLIVTTTVAQEPLLQAVDIRPGTHITAMGADTPEKQELDPAIFAKADLVVADHLSQCAERGELRTALATGVIGKDRIRELGDILRDPPPRAPSAITVADLTGVAVQDIMIAKAVLARGPA